MSGWIKFTDDKCPVPKGTLVKVRYSTGGSIFIELSNKVAWRYVVAYRIYEPPIVAELRKALKVAKKALEFYAGCGELHGQAARQALEKITELEKK